MIAVLILDLKLPIDYVFDKMEMYEVRGLLKFQYYGAREDWEQTRLIAYMTAAVNSKKKLRLTDIMKFPWEEETSDANTDISNSDVERLRKKAEQYLKNNNLK